MASPASPLPRMALIAAILAGIAGGFAWDAGLFSPRRISGGSIATALERANGRVYPGFRRAHAKGACVSGRFEANGAGQAISRATLFAAGRVPVIGRFSTGGGDPLATDGRPVFHALALRFSLPGREEWRMALDHTPTFIVATPADFMALQAASVPDPRTGKPDPARLGAFVGAHPATKAFLDEIRQAPLPSSFANGTYYSINAFRFTNAAGETRPVRWQFEPETPFAALDRATLARLPRDALFDGLRERLRHAPVRWHMILVVANPGDPTDDATVRWTGPHRRIDAGTLVLDHAATEEAGGCRDFNYDPLILPRGVAASDDPLLAARSAAYAASFRRRTREGPRPDALTLAAATGDAP